MAKAQGIIGNFKGKVGNMVGYQLTDSNNKQTQGIRIYQPNVKNPKTSAQAEQRAKLAPINATYRALKMIIDRGNEGLPYGNKSRLAWLKSAFNGQNMPWIVKGGAISGPVGCQLTKGSLAGFSYNVNEDRLSFNVGGVTEQSDVTTVGKISELLVSGCSFVKNGDQITLVGVSQMNDNIISDVRSFVVDTTSTDSVNFIAATSGQLQFYNDLGLMAGAIILSREGDNGQHLRSTTQLIIATDYVAIAPYDADSKAAAIESYMASGAANTDWAEESIQ